MNATIQETLLNLFHQVIEDPDLIPTMPADLWQEGSQEQHLLTSFRTMLERIRQSKQQAEEQLREKEEQYRSIFEASTDALFIQELEDGRVVEVNPAACQIHGYTNDEFLGLTPADFIHPDSFHLVGDTLQTIASGGKYHALGKAIRKDGTTYFAEAHVTQFLYKSRLHLLSIVRDVTEQVKAEAQLREREEQYRSIFEATSDALFIMDLDDGHIVEANPAASNIYGYSYEEFISLPISVVIHPDQLPTLLQNGLPMIRAGGKRHIQGVNLRKDGSAFPIDLQQSVFIYQGKPHILSVIRDITEQVQAQQLLELRVEERTRELSSLLEISHTVASTLHLKPLVGLILDQLKTVVDYTGAAIFTLEGDDLLLLDNRSPTPEEQLRQIRFLPQRIGPIWETISSRQTLLLSDMRDGSPLAQALHTGMGGLMDTTFAYVRASLFVPMTLKDRVIGMLALTSHEADAFTQHHATLAQAIANQAAIAIENARLYAQAQELAALEERQKLARELHDSVSQALYGISLGAHAARTALQRDPEHVAEPLDYVLTLAEAALAEMRALIFELRPESLETEGLIVALTKQAAAIQARHELVVSTDLCDEPNVSLYAKQELYRIAQEAMHNTVKHAHASHVLLRLSHSAHRLLLEVQDDGSGFDVTASFPGHLGLHSMRERVAKLGGTFEIESIPNAGTRIGVRVPDGEQDVNEKRR